MSEGSNDSWSTREVPVNKISDFSWQTEEAFAEVTGASSVV